MFGKMKNFKVNKNLIKIKFEKITAQINILNGYLYNSS